MQPMTNVAAAYDKVAANYAAKFISELEGKHLDKILLTSFASGNKAKGCMIDLGCGPGQTTRFLADCGVTDILGTDLSPDMITVAKEINPGIKFEVADMLRLPYPDLSFGSAVAFYSIVHFDHEQVALALREIHRVLRPGGEFLFSFHVGAEMVHVDTFLDHEVVLDFYFFEISKIEQLVAEAGFGCVDVIQRRPYPDAEHPTNRAYVWVKKPV